MRFLIVVHFYYIWYSTLKNVNHGKTNHTYRWRLTDLYYRRVMIYLGALKGDKILLPPLLSGVAFWVIAWVFNGIRK